MNSSLRHFGPTIPALLAVAGLSLPVAAQVGGMDEDSRFGGDAGQSVRYQDPGVYDQPVYDADDWTFTEDQGWFDEDADRPLREDRIYGTDDPAMQDAWRDDRRRDDTWRDDAWQDTRGGTRAGGADRERQDPEHRHFDDDFYVEQREYGIWGEYGGEGSDEGRGAIRTRDRSADRDADTRAMDGRDQRRRDARTTAPSDRGRTYYTNVEQDRAMAGSVDVIALREDQAGGRTYGIAEEPARARQRDVQERPVVTERTRPAARQPLYPISEYSIWAEYGSSDEPEYWEDRGGFRK